MLSGDEKRILYIEDDPALARLMQKNLERAGYRLDYAVNGEDGLDKLVRGGYAALLVDYRLPGLTGLEIIRTLAAEGNTIPVVMVTGNGNEKIAVEALKAGAADYIVKDVGMGYLELLPIVMEKVFRKQEMLNQKELMFRKIQEREERYRRLVELSPDGIVIVIDGRFVFANPVGVRILGAVSGAALVEKPVLSFVRGKHRRLFAQHLQAMADGNPPWLEEKFVRLDGGEVDVEVSGGPFIYDGRAAVQMIFRDVTERVRSRQLLERMASFDALTELPNRALFFDRLQQAMAHGKRYKENCAVLYLDLDRFKEINDEHGHDAGDQLLIEVAQRFLASVRQCDTVARMGGDEFAILLSKVDGADGVGVVARRILAAVSQPILLAGSPCTIGVSIGIAIFPNDGLEPDTLVKMADMALYTAKREGRKRACFYGGLAHEELAISLVPAEG